MVDIKKFKSEFENVVITSDLMVRRNDVQKLIDKYLTKNNYWVVAFEDGRELKIKKRLNEDSEEADEVFVDAGSGTRFSDPCDAVCYLVDNKFLHIETRYG